MRKIAEFSIKYPVTVAMIILGIVFLGFISFSKIGYDLFPNLNNPRIIIELSADEKPPEEIEKQYIETIESSIIRQSGVVDVKSVCKVGSAQITVLYNWDTDMDAAFLDLQKAMNLFTQNKDIKLSLFRNDPNAAPIMLASISNPDITNMHELRKVVQSYIRNRLIRIDGIADVRLSGGEYREIIIETNPYILKAYNLTASVISSKIQNYNKNISGGSIEELGQKYVIKGISQYNEIKDFENLVVGQIIKQNNSNEKIQVPVFLKDVAKIQYKNKEPDNIVTLNGERCIGISIYKETKYNTVVAVEALNKDFEQIRKALPGYEIKVIQNQGKFIENAIGEVQKSALIGIFFAVIVLFVFLRRIGTTLIVSAAIPISIVATFNLMYFNGLTFNIMTLGGLALGAGMLVDNAIIVVENIFRLLEQGVPLKKAAVEGTAKVGGALLASTLTTVVVFLPIVYLQDASGELFKEQALTVTFSLISSLFVAVLIIPVLSVLFLGGKAKSIKIKQYTYKKYTSFLNKAIDNRYLVVIVAVILIALSYWSLSFVGSEFMPRSRGNEFSVNITLPAGTSLQKTQKTILEVESKMKLVLDKNLKYIYTHAGPEKNGSSNNVFAGENTGFMKIILNNDSKISVSECIKALNDIFKDVEGLEIEYVEDRGALFSILGNESAPVVVEIIGEDLDVLNSISTDLFSELSKNESLINVRNSLEKGVPEVNIKIDRLRTGILNITPASIVAQIKDFLQGKKAGAVENNGELTNIFIKMPDYKFSDLENFEIISGNQKFRLGELAKIKITNAPKEIIRNNQNRVARITAYVNNNYSYSDVIHQVKSTIEEYKMPKGYCYALLGDEMMRKKSFDSLMFALLLSILLVYMVMASQFESLIHPFTVLLTIPLAGVGAILMFLILGRPLNIMAFIGLVMLAGIAVNDSIILVDAINQFKRQGQKLRLAIINAANNRLRPILMTSLTTILGLLPLTLGMDDSAELRSSMAIAVIGGLITSTLLTLVVIPCLYYIFDRDK